MTPEDLAAKHPRLYHLTSPEALAGITLHGLLSTRHLLDLFQVEAATRLGLEQKRRARTETISHPTHGRAYLTDNAPLSERALAKCLEDGLSPQDWLLMLNSRVFFWPDMRDLGDLAQAKLNRNRERIILVLDTFELVRRHFDRVELTAINSGATMRRPASRGLATFVPIGRHSYSEFKNLRRKNGRLREVTVLGGVPDAYQFLVDVIRP